MKKIGLIVGANIEYAPYVKNYIKILNDNKIMYKIIDYKKINLNANNAENIISYKDLNKNNNLLKKLLGYYNFIKFVKKVILKEKFSSLVIFTPQMCLFMKSFLIKNYKKKYILDIRDYNRIFKYPFFLKRLVGNSLLTVISSNGFKKWLPKKYDYLIDHNIIFEKDSSDNSEVNNLKNKNIKIVNCGVIRSFNENLYLIKKLKNKENINLEYRGESSISEKLKKYCKENEIKNCNFYGYYNKEDENKFLKTATFINVMQTNDFLSKYALPNRFYKALLLNKPIIATSDNYVGNLVEKYKLGIVIDESLLDDDLEKKIKEFLFKFHSNNFSIKCKNLLKKIKKEKKNFEHMILETLGD